MRTLTGLDAAADRVRSLPGARVIIGITGEPGVGKSTLAARLCAALGWPSAVSVPMDGFHLGRAVIEGTPLADRRGAPDTFDVRGYIELLSRLRRHDEEVVYAPRYSRSIEDPIGSSIAVAREVRVVVTEGNYLLCDGAWAPVRGILDEVWHLEAPESVRLQRLVARHIASGKAPDEARRWAHGSDEDNARLVRSVRGRADAIITMED